MCKTYRIYKSLVPLLFFVSFNFFENDVSANDSIFSDGFETGEVSNWDSSIIRIQGLNFSPYIDGQDPNIDPTVSEQQVANRMAIVAPYTQWIRGFSSSNGLEHISSVANSLGQRIAAGAWISGDPIANEAEINNLVTLINDPNVDIDVAIVGSEALLRGDVDEDDLLAHINLVRSLVNDPAVLITYADVHGVLFNHRNIIDAVDVLFANYYPYWEGIPLDESMAALHCSHQRLDSISGQKPVIVSETGWPSCGNQIGGAIPSFENAESYFLNFISWANENNIAYFYFSALDETWKVQHEGPQGACWGIFDKDGNLKPGMERVFFGEAVSDNWSRPIPGGNGSPDIEITFVPPSGTCVDNSNCPNIEGQVLHVNPCVHSVVMYIKVLGKWWVKPFALQPFTLVDAAGNWDADFTTGGSDFNATEIMAFLFPASYVPPIVLNARELPMELFDNALDFSQVIR